MKTWKNFFSLKLVVKNTVNENLEKHFFSQIGSKKYGKRKLGKTCFPLAQAAKIPDANRAENLFNHIEMELKKKGRKDGWPKNKEELKERISGIIAKTPKSWFKNSFKSLPRVWKDMVRLGGEMTDHYIPKYS